MLKASEHNREQSRRNTVSAFPFDFIYHQEEKRLIEKCHLMGENPEKVERLRTGDKRIFMQLDVYTLPTRLLHRSAKLPLDASCKNMYVISFEQRGKT